MYHGMRLQCSLANSVKKAFKKSDIITVSSVRDCTHRDCDIATCSQSCSRIQFSSDYDPLNPGYIKILPKSRSRTYGLNVEVELFGEDVRHRVRARTSSGMKTRLDLFEGICVSVHWA